MTTSERATLSRRERRDLRMTRLVPSKWSSSMNRRMIRLTGWRAGHQRRGIPIGLLTTTGRRSGKERTTPLMYLDDGGRCLVVASNSGFDSHPDWYLNLLETPLATFERGRERETVQARTLDADEAAEVWSRLEGHNPLWAAYQRLTERRLPVVALEVTATQ
jgi:deazaflavin-dependent oxidoreductase (nitroreductase family)